MIAVNSRLLISIHALREEDDAARVRVTGVHRISIHALREEDDARALNKVGGSSISIHALREEDDGKDGAITGFDDFISIHALREEDDCGRCNIFST